MSEGQERLCANGFKALGIYLKESWHAGRGKVNLWAYFLVGIVGISGLGVWAAILISQKGWPVPDVLLSLVTCAIPIIVSSCLDFIFDQQKRHFLLGFSISVAFLVISLDALALIFSKQCLISYLLATVSMAIAYYMWWIANAWNPKLDNVCDYLTPIGSVNKDIGGSQGDFKL